MSSPHRPEPVAPEPIVQVRAPRALRGRDRGPRAERPRSQWPLLVFGLGAVLLLAAGAFLLLRPRQNVYVLRFYQAATVQKADLTETETAVGNLTSGDVRPVAPTTDGTVQEVLVQAGQDVTQGQVLARLGSPALEQVRVRARDALLGVQDDQAAALQAAQSAVGAAGRDVQTATAAVPLARRSLEGAEGLYALGGVA